MALVDKLDADRQAVLDQPLRTMSPRFGLDGHGNSRQPSRDGPPFLIDLIGWTGQGPKPGGPAGLKHQ
jgi:hypothetical protein